MTKTKRSFAMTKRKGLIMTKRRNRAHNESRMLLLYRKHYKVVCKTLTLKNSVIPKKGFTNKSIAMKMPLLLIL